jgi:hypothetical protein
MSSFSTLDTMRFVGTVLESSFYGLYCVAFAVHARIRSTHKGGGTNIVIYPLSILFTLCTIFCAIDTAQTLIILRYEGTQDPQVGLASYNLNIANTAMYCAITFLAQGILIYRCWLMWGRKLLVITIPTILAWVTFGTSLAMLRALIEPPSLRFPDSDNPSTWLYPLSTAAFSISIAVNATVAILLACKIFMNLYDSQRNPNLKTSVNPIRYIISVLNESGMLMLGCQVIWLVLYRRREPAFFLVRGPIIMIYGLTPTLILRRITQIVGQISQNSTKEKPRADRSTAIRFVIST